MKDWKERIHEELEDACSYAKLSEEAEKDGHRDQATFLWLIGRDEATHARYLISIYDGELSPECKEKWDKVRDMYHV